LPDLLGKEPGVIAVSVVAEMLMAGEIATGCPPV
jgi:xanthine/CO dehydrogenase XdhC/CoxF family maturation factor